MKKPVLIAILCLLSLTIYGQDELYMASGDTLTGEITILYPEDLFEEIILESGDSKKRYKAFEFICFTKDSTDYKSIKSGQKYRVMQLEKPGYLSLWRFRVDNSYSFNGQYLYRKDGQGQEVPGMLFKKTMMNFLSDCNAVEAALKEGAYKRKNVEELVDDYNACIGRKTAGQEEQKMETATKPSITASPTLEQAEELSNRAKEIGDDELASMLTDVAGKLSEGSAVPSYLKNAIEEHVGESHELYAAITALLTKI